jgi:glycosyltransferase involved in cell wall biosynthesis
MDKIKVLFIHHAAGWGGAPKSMIQLINNLDKNKFDVEVLLLKSSNVANILKENGIRYSIAESIFYKKFYRFFAHSEAGYLRWYQVGKFIRLSILWILSRWYFAKNELTKFNVDIIHLNSSVLTDWLSPAKTKNKVIMQVREPFRKGKFDLLHTFFISQMRRYADHIIAISKDNSQRIGIPEKTSVIYNFSNIPINNPHESTYASNKVLYLGGASKIKGFYTLVEALDYLNHDVKLYFGGSYGRDIKSFNVIRKIALFVLPYRNKKEKAISKIDKNPNAIIIGLIDEVDKYFNEVCCLVSPFSVPHFARPVIEAHCHSKPVIGSDVEGMDEIIIHNVNGLIVAKDSSIELAIAINELTSNSNKAKKFGQQGKTIAKKNFSNKNILEYQKLYMRVISKV